MTENSTSRRERGVEQLRSLQDDSRFGLVSVRPDSEGVLLYEDGASRVGNRPALEVPKADPYLVDESDIPGVMPPSVSFKELCAQYNCTTWERKGFTYVVPTVCVE